MSDHAPASIKFLACPPEAVDDVIGFLEMHHFDVDWGGETLATDRLILGQVYTNDDAAVGAEGDIPLCDGLAYTFQQDAKYEWDGVAQLKLPGGPAYGFSADSQGNIHFDASEIDLLLARHGPNASVLVVEINSFTDADVRHAIAQLEAAVDALPEADRTIMLPEED